LAPAQLLTRPLNRCRPPEECAPISAVSGARVQTETDNPQRSTLLAFWNEHDTLTGDWWLLPAEIDKEQAHADQR